MKNKRASLSTLIFIIMVIVVCFTSLYAFAKHKSILDREMVDIGSVVRSNFQDDVAYLQLKTFSDESIFYAYNQLISEYNFNFKLTDGNNYNVFDYSKLQNGNAASELTYRTKFESLVQKKYDSLVSSYPQYTSSDKEIFLALKNAQFDFDGDKISTRTSINVNGEEKNGIKISYSKMITYNSSLSLFDLVDFRKISSAINSCPYSSDVKLREECTLSQFSGFEFDKDFSGFKTVTSDSGDFYLAKLVSKEGYFVGPVGSGESEIVHPAISVILPIKSEDESKLRGLFGSSSSGSPGSNLPNLLPLEKTPL
ncbi:Uncharacterised protein [uncultured archaeon]|nr:Uncharacterised protein [uncultured archaeon]